MSKYHNKKTRCLSKHVHDSKFEASYCNRLLAMKQAGEISDFSIQVPYPMDVNGKHICTHVVDFVVHYYKPGQAVVADYPIRHGLFRTEEVHEVKGCETEVWKIKRKLFKALYPAAEYIVIKRGGFNAKRYIRARRKAGSGAGDG